MHLYSPSTVPGCRVPHVWLADGRSLYDELGPDYTLLRMDAAADVSALVRAAAERGVPLKVIDVNPRDPAPAYRNKLILCRPDQHVAWRGNELPVNVAELVDLVRGAA
jgi:hypothetical protein